MAPGPPPSPPPPSLPAPPLTRLSRKGRVSGRDMACRLETQRRLWLRGGRVEGRRRRKQWRQQRSRRLRLRLQHRRELRARCQRGMLLVGSAVVPSLPRATPPKAVVTVVEALVSVAEVAVLGRGARWGQCLRTWGSRPSAAEVPARGIKHHRPPAGHQLRQGAKAHRAVWARVASAPRQWQPRPRRRPRSPMLPVREASAARRWRSRHLSPGSGPSRRGFLDNLSRGFPGLLALLDTPFLLRLHRWRQADQPSSRRR